MLELPRKPNGKRHRKLRRARTQTEARRKLRELRAEYEELGRGAFSGRTVANMIDDYATVWLASEPGKTDRDRNNRFGRVMTSHFGETRKVTDITVSDCDALLAAYVTGSLASSGRPVSGEYAARLRAFVGKAFGNELRLGYLRHNPATEAKIPVSEAARRSRRALTATEWRMLRTHSTGIVRLIVDLCGRHGLRPQELRSVRWNDVDLDGGTLSVIVKPKTEKSIRTIRLHPEAVADWAGTSVRMIYKHYRRKLAEVSELPPPNYE